MKKGAVLCRHVPPFFVILYERSTSLVQLKGQQNELHSERDNERQDHQGLDKNHSDHHRSKELTAY
jgi:hypothetical protein